jgi:hypothetical protein
MNDNGNGKPKMLAPIYENIPQEMQARRQWINWKLQKNPKPTGKPWTKIPLDPKTGRKAATTRDTTWADFDLTCRRYEEYAAQEGKGTSEGLGFVLRGDHVGIDLDGCRDPRTGELEPWAADIINRIHSYTEVSPSGTGIRIICRGKLPPGARRKGMVEMYDESSPRYLTITGHVLNDGLHDIHDRQAEIETIHAEYLGSETTEETKPTPAFDSPEDLDVDQVLEKALTFRNDSRFRRLWRGEWQGEYRSQSEADLALAGDLAYWCGPDPDRIDAMFRRSGLYRDKWERTDYRDDTIAKAMDRDKFYDWGVDESEIERVVTGGQLPPKSQASNSVRKRAYTIGELSRLPKPQWHVQGIFAERSIVILWGESGSGKTFLALDWALCTATGEPWLGEHKVKPGSVVYIASEGKSGLPKRCLRWLEHHEMPEPENFWIVPEAFEMVERESFADLVQVLGDLGEQHALIVIDTLSRNMGGSENDGDDMRAFTKAAELLQTTFGATVVVIHHTGWDNARERGHSSLRGNSDTMISARKLGDRLTDGIEVKCVKQKDSDLFDTFGVACERVGAGDDASLVLTERIDTDKLTEERKQERQNERLIPILKCLPDDAARPMALPDVVAASGTARSTCHRLLGDAINAGYVVRVGERQPRYWLTAAGKAMVARGTDFQFGLA